MTTARTKAAPKAVAKTANPKTAPKAAPKTETEGFALPTMPALDVPPAMRELAENSMTQSKEAFEKFKSVAEDASSALEETMEKTRENVLEFNAKALEIAQETTEASFAHAKDIFAVKSFAEAIELQTAFMKKQMETAQGQAKVFQEMTTKFTEDASVPYKTVFEKSVAAFKVA